MPLEILPLSIGAFHLCAIRNRNIVVTPEELVRQSYLLQLLRDQFGPSNIDLEVALGDWSARRFPRSAADFRQRGVAATWKGRADLVVWHTDSDGQDAALFVVELKRNDLPLSDAGIDQLLDYADALHAKWAQLTNGRDAITFMWDEKTDQYRLVHKLPSPAEISAGDVGAPLPEIELRDHVS